MRRIMCLTLVTLALVAIVAAPANAAIRITCIANGFTDIEGSGPYTWNIVGSGTCYDQLHGNFLVDLAGSGTSDTLGLCDNVVVTNLNLAVGLNVLNLRTLQTTNLQQFWKAPVTTFPLVTPFFIHPSTGGTNGLGIISTRVLLSCPPNSGNHVTTFLFTTAV